MSMKLRNFKIVLGEKFKDLLLEPFIFFININFLKIRYLIEILRETQLKYIPSQNSVYFTYKAQNNCIVNFISGT